MNQYVLNEENIQMTWHDIRDRKKLFLLKIVVKKVFHKNEIDHKAPILSTISRLSFLLLDF